MLSAPPSPILIAASVVVAALFLVGTGLIARFKTFHLPGRLDGVLAHPFAPFLAGAASAAITLFVWGSLREPPIIQDEQAYLLQARIFATGHWTGAVPPVPEFFEQVHVFVEPHLASKYPPGNSMLLVPGVWLGLPGLVPVLLSAVAGGLIFHLARQVSDPGVALLTWALWATSRTSLAWRASYLSENTTGVLWLLTLVALLLWTSRSRPRYLVVVSVALGWAFLTRPLSAVGFGAPILVLVAARVWRLKLWRQAALAMVAAIPIVFLSFLWQRETLGKWFTSPYAEYSREYAPSEKPGFGLDPTPPARPSPPEIAWVWQNFLPLHAAHVPRALPKILAERVAVLLLTLGEQWRVVLVCFFVVGCLRASGSAVFALGSAASLIAAYLIYASSSRWVVYYAEIFPVFFFVVACGVADVLRKLARLDGAQVRAALAVTTMMLVPCLIWDVISARETNDQHSAFHRTASQLLATIPDHAAVVFVHYPPGHDYHLTLVENSPNFRTTRLWLVYDRGPGDDRLLAVTDRPAYRLFTESWTLERIR